MPQAAWNGKIIAQADPSEVQLVEGNVYFPPDKVDHAFLKSSDTHTFCPWKGTASYYDVVVDGKTNKDAAWFYPDTKDAAMHVKGYVAFWRGVEVSK
jgi:uncharacterized protein (DUF427 family)